MPQNKQFFGTYNHIHVTTDAAVPPLYQDTKTSGHELDSESQNLSYPLKVIVAINFLKSVQCLKAFLLRKV